MQHLQSQLSLTTAQVSDAGIKAVNEDCIGLCLPKAEVLPLKGAVAVIADGVSAAQAGKEASETCVRTFITDYYATPDAWSVKKSGQRVLSALNRWLVGQGQVKGHITTLSILILKSCQAYLFHVGDSRIYRLRAGQLECLTHDHTTQVGKDTHYLYRAMGMTNTLEVDFSEHSLQKGDVFLLTTDGIHDFLDDHTLHAQLAGHKQADEAGLQNMCEHIVKQSLAAGSHDNLSCQCIRVDEVPDANSQDVYRALSKLVFPPALNVGHKIDGLEVIKLLHSSERSYVYLVQDQASHKYYVMKAPSINYEDDPAYIERFSLEQWIGKRIESPYVAKVIDRPKSALYTLMEYIDGVSLSKWLQHNPKPEINEVVRLLELISRGIRAFHRKDILHQDIKPDNIIIDYQGIPKIIDFGSCYVAGIEEITTPFARQQALGTASYSAPETRFMQPKTIASDLFSLAVIGYEMLTGGSPFSNALETLKDEKQLSRLRYESASSKNPLVPLWMDGAFKKALQPRVSARYDSLSEFIFDLQHPNRKLLSADKQPLIERHPLAVWKGLALIQTLIILTLLYVFLG